MAAHPDDGEDVIVGDLTNENVAKEMAGFIADLQKATRYVGISAFLLLALLKRIRVRVWCGRASQDVLHTHAPWTSHLTTEFEEAPVEAIACRFSVDALGVPELTLVEDPRQTNHWVAGVRSESGTPGDGGGGGHTPW